MINHEKSTYTVAGYEIDVTDLPAKSIDALLSRGLTRFLGNEQASKVSSWKAAFKTEHGTEPTDDNVAAYHASVVADAVKRLVEGTIGTRQPSVTVDPLEKEMHRLAKAEVVEILRANSIKVPKEGEAVTFADGSQKTLDDMIEARLAKRGEAIEKEAKRILAAKAKRAEGAKVEGPVTAESLGF